MGDCVFCKIAHKELSAEFVFDDVEVMVFPDIKPSAPIHLLVVTKKHIPSIMHLVDADKDLVARMIFVARDIAAQRNMRGYRLSYNVGREGGQLIDHLHLHLQGGWQ